MDASDVLENAFAMPLARPSLQCGPYRHANREHFIVTYHTDHRGIASHLVPSLGRRHEFAGRGSDLRDGFEQQLPGAGDAAAASETDAEAMGQIFGRTDAKFRCLDNLPVGDRVADADVPQRKKFS